MKIHSIITAVVTALIIMIAGAVKAEEIRFEKGSFEEVLAKAKSENKNVMIDFYTDWCNWCVELDKVVYANSEVAEYANEEQINWKIDAEKGEGIELTKRYNVKGFPTIIFIDPDGKEIDRIVGFLKPADFLKVIKDFNNGVNTYGDLTRRLKENPDDATANYLMGKKLFDYMETDRSRQYFEKVLKIDKENASGYTDNAHLYFALLTNDLEGLKDFSEKYPGSDVLKTVVIIVAENCYQNNENYEEAEKQYRIAFENYGDDDEEIRFSYGQYLLTYSYSIMRDEEASKEMNKRGVNLALKSTEYIGGSVNEANAQYILSELYYRLGNIEDAKSSIDKAIKINSKKLYTDQKKKLEGKTE